MIDISLPESRRLPEGLFDHPLAVERVLYEAEQPIIYITRTRQGQQMLAYLASEAENEQWLIVAPATPHSLHRLESGSIGVREALTSTWMWLVKENFASGIGNVWSVTEMDIPDSHLPLEGTPLLPEHRIAFSTRAIGEGITLGCVPSSVVSFVADAARSSLKAILDHVMAAKSEGRPTDAQRALYDLPVRQLKFASFEIALSAPPEDLFKNEVISQALAHLENGLDWAESTAVNKELVAANDAEAEAILRATLALTPPTSGVITAVEVGGSWLGNKKYSLSRESRTKVSRRLRHLQTEEIVVYVGRIGEIDDDKLSFTLRDVANGSERRGIFPEELLDDMRTYYFESTRIEISGVIRNSKLRVTAAVPKIEQHLAIPLETDTPRLPS
jgi:hypothetical protein